MGWLEFNAWLKARQRRHERAAPSPDSWDVHDSWFEEQHARVRQEERGA